MAPSDLAPKRHCPLALFALLLVLVAALGLPIADSPARLRASME